MLENVDEVTEDEIFLVDFAHVGNFCRSYPLQQEHFLVGNVHELPKDHQEGTF